MINTIILGHVLNVLPKLPAESVSCIATSPPYWGLRNYGIEPVIWDGDKDCEHEWGNNLPPRGQSGWHTFEHKYHSSGSHKTTLGSKLKEEPKKSSGHGQFCTKCNAWRGSLGFEPTFELYIKHLCDIFDESKRVLRKDGTCFVNIGDSYGGSGNASGHKEDTRNLGYKTLEMGATQGNQKTTSQYAKSLLDIPYHFSIEMVKRGWIKRNTIIWCKPNCMPSSAPDRFTVDFEYLFFFSKSNKTLFWTNEKTLECVSKKPLGIKEIEGKDWEWRECPNCKGTGKVKVNIEDRPEIYGENDPAGMRRGRMRDFLDKKKDMYQAGDKPCKRCKELGKIKYSFWTGHDYWFEQQFEKYAPDTLPRMDRGVNFNKWTLGADGQTPHNLSQPRLRKERGYKTKQMDKEIHRQQHHGKDINYGRYGRNKRCVWKISTKSFKAAHFATFPETLIEPIIKAGCPEFVCKKCGKARVKIYDNQIYFGIEESDTKYKGLNAGSLAQKRQAYRKLGYESPPRPKEIGYSDCGCNAGWESGINLDPFMGAGTSALVALKQRKRFIGIEIKQEYIDMSYKRIARVQQEIF